MPAITHHPRIILWDIETSHNLIAKFRLYDEYVPFENIRQERYIICASWMVLGESQVESVAVRANQPHNDYPVCDRLHKVLSTADALVAHNGEGYDIKFVEGRMLIHKFAPLPPISTIDTLKVARRRFLFNCNRLDYLGKLLGVGRKIRVPNSVWLEALNGSADAIQMLVKYNRQDVRLLRDIYLKLRPYVPDHINRQFDTRGPVCGVCGSRHVTRQGMRQSITRRHQTYQCQACGSWSRDTKASTTASRRPLA